MAEEKKFPIKKDISSKEGLDWDAEASAMGDMEDVESEFFRELLNDEREPWIQEEDDWEIPKYLQRAFGSSASTRRRFHFQEQKGKWIKRAEEHPLPYYQQLIQWDDVVRNMAKELGDGEPEELLYLFVSVLFYFLSEYHVPQISEILQFLQQPEDVVTETILGLSDLHPAKRSYLFFWEKIEERPEKEEALGVNGFSLAAIMIELAAIKWESLLGNKGDSLLLDVLKESGKEEME